MGAAFNLQFERMMAISHRVGQEDSHVITSNKYSYDKTGLKWLYWIRSAVFFSNPIQ